MGTTSNRCRRPVLVLRRWVGVHASMCSQRFRGMMLNPTIRNIINGMRSIAPPTCGWMHKVYSCRGLLRLAYEALPVQFTLHYWLQAADEHDQRSNADIRDSMGCKHRAASTWHRVNRLVF